jgi:peptide/nickel transport system substrate-binding protein
MRRNHALNYVRPADDDPPCRSRAGRPRRLLVAGLSLVVLGLLVGACGSSSSSSSGSAGGGGVNNANAATKYGTVLYGSLPPTGTPKSGGTISMGQLSGQTPTYIFPIIPGADVSTGTISFQTSLFIPLYAGPQGAIPKIDYALSAASGPPVASDGNKTFTIPLKTNLKWSNGQPVVANDFLFFLALLKAAVNESSANWGQFNPGEFPLNVVSASAPNSHTVVLHVDKAYNPGFFLNNQLADTDNTFPIPSTDWNVASANGPHITDWQNPANAKKIYDYLNKAGASVASFASNPLWQDVDGPFKLKSFSATNSSYALTPNPSYGGTPKSVASEVDVNTYTGFTSELNAMKSGSVDVATGLDPSQLAESAALKSQGITVFGGPGWGWFGGIINFKDTTDHFDKVIAQGYVRAAIDHMIDQPAIIKGIYKGAAVTAYGPTPSAPASPYAPADATTPPYAYSPSTAVSQLKARGWKVVPNGQTTCAKAGTAADECGAGIPAGTPLKFVWANTPSSFSTTGVLESEALASIAKQAAGINIVLQTKTFNFLTSNYNDQNPGAAKYTNDWGVNNYGGIYQDYYPTQNGIDNPGGGLNTGAYDDSTANGLIHASVFGGDPAAVKNEASYLTKSLPVFYFPAQDYLLAVNTKNVGGPPDGWTSMTQQQFYPQYWYQVK